MRSSRLAVVLLAGCTGLLGGLPQDGVDGGAAAELDAGLDPGADAAVASSPDAGVDAGSGDAGGSSWDGGFSRWDAGDDGFSDAAIVDPPGWVPGPIDLLLAGLDAGTWAVVPNSTLQAVCPGYLDGGTGDHYQCGAMITAWSGAAFDDARDRLVVFGGGHADSFYNQVSAFDLTSLRWLALTGVVADHPWIREAFYERCGYYPVGEFPIDDPGQPATNGTYGRFRYSPNRRVLVLVNDTQQNVAIYKLR